MKVKILIGASIIGILLICSWWIWGNLQIQKYSADKKYCQKDQDCGCSTCGCLNFYWKDKMDCIATFEGAICDKVGCVCEDNQCVLAEVKPGVIPSLQGVFYQIPSDPTVCLLYTSPSPRDRG